MTVLPKRLRREHLPTPRANWACAADRVRWLMEARGVDVAELARRMGRTPGSIRRWLREGLPGSMRLGDVLRLCRALNTGPNFLYGVCDKPGNWGLFCAYTSMRRKRGAA